MKDFFLQTYTAALPIILTALMGYAVWLLKNQKKDRDANSKGTMLLLRVQLIEYHDKYMKLGSIPSYAYENFMEMYEAYHELGGNGMFMKNINWMRKLTSRKFWTAVASFTSMMILATGGTENTATQVTALIMAGASIVAYIIGEGLTDSANTGIEVGVEIEDTEKEV